MCAEREGVSLNQFITTCLAEAVGERARQPVMYFLPNFEAAAHMSIRFSGDSIISTSPLGTGLQRFPGAHQTAATGINFMGPVVSQQKREHQRA